MVEGGVGAGDWDRDGGLRLGSRFGSVGFAGSRGRRLHTPNYLKIKRIHADREPAALLFLKKDAENRPRKRQNRYIFHLLSFSNSGAQGL